MSWSKCFLLLLYSTLSSDVYQSFALYKYFIIIIIIVIIIIIIIIHVWRAPAIGFRVLHDEGHRLSSLPFSRPVSIGAKQNTTPKREARVLAEAEGHFQSSRGNNIGTLSQQTRWHISSIRAGSQSETCTCFRDMFTYLLSASLDSARCWQRIARQTHLKFSTGCQFCMIEMLSSCQSRWYCM